MAGPEVWSPWRKSSRSDAGGNCVEVSFGQGRVRIRDSKSGAQGPVLEFSAAQWRAFRDAVLDGEFEPLRGSSPR